MRQVTHVPVIRHVLKNCTVSATGAEFIRILNRPRCGIAAALNRGIEAATLPDVARCDSDDLSALGRLGWQARLARAAPGLHRDLRRLLHDGPEGIAPSESGRGGTRTGRDGQAEGRQGRHAFLHTEPHAVRSDPAMAVVSVSSIAKTSSG